MTSSSSRQLRQLMSLDMPKVDLVGNSPVNHHRRPHIPLSSSSSSSVLVFPLCSNIYSSDTTPWSCLACGHDDDDDDPRDLSSLTTVSRGTSLLLQSLLLRSDADEGPLVLCSVCLGAVTRFLALTEEVEELKTRIQAVVKLRQKNTKLSSSADDDDKASLHGDKTNGALLDEEEVPEDDAFLDPEVDAVPTDPSYKEEDVDEDPLGDFSHFLDPSSFLLQTLIVNTPATNKENYYEGHVEDTKPDPETLIISHPLTLLQKEEGSLLGGGRKCQKCGNHFADMLALTNHLRKDHLATLFNDRHVCPLCNAYFLSGEVFAAHTHPDPIKDPLQVLYICAPCGSHKSFPTRRQFSQHLQRYHRKKNAGKCGGCGKMFQSLSSHRPYCPHTRTQGKAQCGVCKDVFGSSLDRLDHERVIHKGLPSNRCYFCGKVLPSLTYLETHLRTNHTMEAPFGCSKCGREFMVERALKSHQAVPCGEGVVPKRLKV